MLAWLALGLLVAAGVVLMLRHDAGTLGGLEMADIAMIVASVALIIWIGSGLIGSYRGRLSGAVKDAVTWGLILLALVAVYAFRAPLLEIGRRVSGELLPPGSELGVAEARPGEKAVRIRKRSNGHFYVKSRVNGVEVTMMVDTGASSVVLRPKDAELAGIDLQRLTYAVPVNTANGMAYAARVKLRGLAIGGILVPEVEALVAQPGALTQSLLGMSFLSRLRSYEFSGDYMTLRG
jgi:aspartyl protease family protein